MTRKKFSEKFGREPHCDPNQLEMLLCCSKKKDITDWNQWREKNCKTIIWLEGADLEKANLRDAHLEKANLLYAHLKEADLYNANLEGADLRDAHLEGANLMDANEGARLEGARLEGAHLEGAHLKGAHLEGVNFSGAILDGKTIISECSIDEKTNFSMTGLDSARVQPALLAALKTNIRRIAWKGYYDQKIQDRPKKTQDNINCWGLIILALAILAFVLSLADIAAIFLFGLPPRIHPAFFFTTGRVIGITLQGSKHVGNRSVVHKIVLVDIRLRQQHETHFRGISRLCDSVHLPLRLV